MFTYKHVRTLRLKTLRQIWSVTKLDELDKCVLVMHNTPTHNNKFIIMWHLVSK